MEVIFGETEVISRLQGLLIDLVVWQSHVTEWPYVDKLSQTDSTYLLPA